MRAQTTLLVFYLSAVPALCIAQHTHQFEIGGFGSYTRYDRAFALDKQIGGGGRLGYFFSRVVGIEFEMGYQQPTPYAGGTNATATLASGSLVLNTGNARNVFYILGGYTRLEFGDRPGYSFSDNAVHGAMGDRLFLGDRVALRLEGRAIYSPSTRFSSGNWAGHIIGSAGLSIFTGPSARRDADLDGVADGKDACPGTPVGAVVDARGCPSDSDRDKVFNGLDACPNTVEGAEVDARGCPKDTDGDGVYDGIEIPTAMASPMVPTSVRTPPPARPSTRLVARSIATTTAWPTASTSAPTRRPALKSIRRDASAPPTPMGTASTTPRTNVPARRQARVSTRQAVRSSLQRPRPRSCSAA